MRRVSLYNPANHNRGIHMLRFLFRSLPLLACLLLLAACASGGAKHSQEPQAGIKPSALTKDVFTLPDERDMGYAMVKLEKEGNDAEALTEAARTVSVDNLMAVLQQQAEQVGVVQSSQAGWVIEARNLVMEDALYSTATIIIRREHYKIKGSTVSMAKLQRLILDGQESTVALGWALYRDVMRQVVQQ